MKSQEFELQKYFKNGSQWLRADFHLHTVADKEAYTDWDPNGKESFKKKYVAHLKEAGIRVGVITNHNKFDHKEYKSIRKEARKEGIYILPGVELSVNDGQSGVHVCIVFDPESWFPEDEDFINRLLDKAFPDLTGSQRENRNSHSNWNFAQLLQQLGEEKKFNGRDSFVIPAHVNQDKGFFEEIKPGRIDQLAEHAHYKEFVLGFQKVTSTDTKSYIDEEFNEKPPALVEGCDCKNFEDIGKARKENGKPVHSYIKIGDFNFTAVKYALMDARRNTLAAEAPKPEHARIKNIRFETAADAPLADREFHVNSNLNCLIGIRGSGKSSVLEAIRYGLGKELEVGTSKDKDYKDSLVQNTLRSGGKMIIELENPHGHQYRIERISGEKPKIYRDGELLSLTNVDESLISVLYFGQKDLSEIGTEGFSKSLMDKFFGEHVGPIREQIEEKQRLIVEKINELHQLEEVDTKINETEEEQATLKEKMKAFKEHKVDEKLKRQVAFNKDYDHLKEMKETGEEVLYDLRQNIDENREALKDLREYESKENPELFKRAYSAWKSFESKVDNIGKLLREAENDIKTVTTCLNELSQLRQNLKDEFAEIKRSINLQKLNPDDYVNYEKRYNLLSSKLKELKKKKSKRKSLQNSLQKELSDLQSLWHKEYQTLQKSIDELNQRGLAIQVELEYRGDHKAFEDFLKSLMQGSGITGKKFEDIADSYNDPIQIYGDLEDAESTLYAILKGGTHLQKFKENFYDNLSAALTYQVPNQYVLKYDGKNIQFHSLGQRASAVMVFLLARRDNDLIIIDQPEDDIDNQSVYRDVIRELINLKEKTQFIFATHNPNIPVLGESEQVFTCRFEGDNIQVDSGSIDTEHTQQAIIEIMEGGREAFEQRERKYQEWKH